MDFKHFKEKLEALVTGDSPYSCPKCDLTMNNKWLMARHMAGVHGFRDKFLDEALKEKTQNSQFNLWNYEVFCWIVTKPVMWKNTMYVIIVWFYLPSYCLYISNCFYWTVKSVKNSGNQLGISQKKSEQGA